MQLSSFLFATIALAVSSAWAQAEGATSNDPTCLRICRDDPVECQAGWVSTQIGAEGEEVCIHSKYLVTRC
ncbi:hypothetical protein N7517_003036 [Penicillium concentricum]|uniref:Extracellular membrane protein CFEM domain-containing protein n=1 Tax=Penicillium concentricum TaxID=293559 RepID=A0A9W9SVT6_9EURO|nr:uncharacterized protein N7517_003036 [Penicillium concentricum]KAJ5385125.1 hypothetical protein N7517_003036 [Penicillium concentricum]